MVIASHSQNKSVDAENERHERQQILLQAAGVERSRRE